MNKILLLVRDESMTRRLGDVLEQKSFQVIRCRDPYLCRLYLEHVHTDLLIMDVENQQLRELIKLNYFRDWRKQIRTIFLLPKNAYFGGEDHHSLRLNKPFSNAELLKLLCKLNPLQVGGLRNSKTTLSGK